MADDKRNQTGRGRRHINAAEAQEVRDWAKLLGVTEAQLIAALKAVGNDVALVEVYLKDHPAGD